METSLIMKDIAFSEDVEGGFAVEFSKAGVVAIRHIIEELGGIEHAFEMNAEHITAMVEGLFDYIHKTIRATSDKALVIAYATLGLSIGHSWDALVDRGVIREALRKLCLSRDEKNELLSAVKASIENLNDLIIDTQLMLDLAIQASDIIFDRDE